MVVPRLLPDLMAPMLMAPPLAWATATPPSPAAALPPLPRSPPGPPATALPSPPSALETARPPSALSVRVVSLLTVPPLIETLRGAEERPYPQEALPVLTTMVFPWLSPEVTVSRSIMPPLALATAVPALPAAASPPWPVAPPLPPATALPSPPLALLTASPPSALRLRVVSVLTRPPLMAMVDGWEQDVAPAAGASVARPKRSAATGTTRQPASSCDRCCRMKCAAPGVGVCWVGVVISCSCRLRSNLSSVPCLVVALAGFVVWVISLLLARGGVSLGSVRVVPAL